ncbi:MAG: bifunctional methylenetetrahydrofolate dehydrogenase/methenyltetrahydrofolate cyclohydrolase FolD [Limnochordia bacterium]|jgi:methylenetetrahydrofolate dehydrogenase (NADP+)/methenyltetrahydrofolate cyclohydrolase|nr:bifunctional methylenetetrahydrofolate dehydrogenase/methenyltetrahydrofolate cyclohydrolase FolD [Limnochordia bacterium]MDD2628828.1 bifunctional methylenetetrahydrofolate dehydrogenase/methenyltetrahydrofolate cyclohydrolase FolD [Limnochordia bacterium]MDD4518509.1 bifunctional methylenetetrahydrofolate dehydrogenase/methenyltetrahydrofolate cyclohydrolase FolD [Limnochordia bacterium]
MLGNILDGKAIAAEIRAKVKEDVSRLQSARGITPGLAVVLVGDDAASQIYVNMKKRACNEVGFHSKEYRLPASTTQEELLQLINRLNVDQSIHGILVQLPLPKHLDEKYVINTISPAKDVDGFHPINVGKLSTGEPSLLPCTPAGIMELLRRTKVDLSGKQAVVVGRSNIVGKPTAMLLLKENATVTVCHSRTKDLAEECRRADVLVAAVGKPELIKGEWIKEGAIVIDVGMNRVEGKLFGDVEFASARQRASFITPVPGGVGPMTIAMLMANTLEAVGTGTETE